jgi:hypothetical protein
MLRGQAHLSEETPMFIKEIAYTMAATLALAAALVVAPAMSTDKAPMPQTKGMQGMDPKQHDQAAKDPYEGCVPNPDKAAQQAEHPMPDTKGMKGMDPKAHTVDCPDGHVPAEKPAHTHK